MQENRECRHKEFGTKSARPFPLFYLLMDISYDTMKLSSWVFSPHFPPVKSQDGWFISQKVHTEKSTGLNPDPSGDFQREKEENV